MRVIYDTFEEAYSAHLALVELTNQARESRNALCPHRFIESDYEVGSSGPISRFCAVCGKAFPDG